jgi:methyltransferase family protein
VKALVRKAAKTFGYEIRRIPPPDAKEEFRSDYYLRGDARRLEHLASLRIPVAGMTVLEVGAGIGDHSTYYIDRGCQLTIAEVRQENLLVLQQRFPDQSIVQLDMENPPDKLVGAPFDVVHCYGLLYHLANPERALRVMGANCRKLLFLETCVSFGSHEAINPFSEQREYLSQSFSGTGCRPTRPWVFQQLKREFPHVYCPMTQPNHEDFPLDWNAPQKHRSTFGNIRAVFVASRIEIVSDVLASEMLYIQTRHE